MASEIVKKLNQLEIKALVYCDFWGPDSEEVKSLQAEILRYNLLLLDEMMAEQL
jgi:hypothetical protein